MARTRGLVDRKAKCRTRKSFVDWQRAFYEPVRPVHARVWVALLADTQNQRSTGSSLHSSSLEQF